MLKAGGCGKDLVFLLLHDRITRIFYKALSFVVSLINCPPLKNITLHFGASAPPFIIPTIHSMHQNFTASCPNFYFIATHSPIKIN